MTPHRDAHAGLTPEDPGMGPVPVPISSIRIDGGTQPRATIDVAAVADYMNAMADGASFPPVVVFYDGTSYWLADGFHRIRAAEQAGSDEIACEVYQGTQQDAQWYSFGANKTNGLRRTNQDKQRAVKSALQHPSGAQLSNCQIAAHVGVDEATVRNGRKKFTSEFPKSTKRKGRDGRTINVANIGKAAEDADPALKPVPVECAPASPEVPASPMPARKTRSQRIERLARVTLSFMETTKRLAHMVRWLGETAGEFDEAELRLSNAGNAIAAVIAEIERKAVAADPLNASRLGIKEAV